MKKRIIIVHGWGESKISPPLTWLKNKLEKHGFEVLYPEMPNTNHPKIDAWVSCLSETTGKPDENTYFIGHSIGCQTILRYLETIENKIGGAVFIAGWFSLKNVEAEDEDIETVTPWLEEPIDLSKAKECTSKFTAIFSDNDYYVPFTENKEVFEKELGAKVVVEKKKGHFVADDGVTELPQALYEILEIIEN